MKETQGVFWCDFYQLKLQSIHFHLYTHRERIREEYRTSWRRLHQIQLGICRRIQRDSPTLRVLDCFLTPVYPAAYKIKMFILLILQGREIEEKKRTEYVWRGGGTQTQPTLSLRANWLSLVSRCSRLSDTNGTTRPLVTSSR